MKLGIILIAFAILSGASQGYAETHEVRIVSDYENLRFQFEPPVLTIQPGDTVRWYNEADEEHNVITYPGGFPKGAEGFKSSYLQVAGETFEHTFKHPGTYQYHCLPHLLMGMRGEIVVKQRSERLEMHEPSRREIMAYRQDLLEWFDEDDNLLQIRVDEKDNRNSE